MPDFTLRSYQSLLEALLQNEYRFLTFRDFIASRPNLQGKVAVLRHDVDRLPGHSLRFALIQHQKGIAGSYYFRAVPESWDEAVVRQIASLGHEVGYHYEDLTLAGGNTTKAFGLFAQHLEALRQLAPVSTICMHGSPRSRYDSRDLWKHYDYRSLGIVAEPYFDVDFDRCFYLTDTGRRWDGFRVSVRDKVPQQEAWIAQGLTFRTTSQIVKAVRAGVLPHRVMFTFHPQRWTSQPIEWAREWLFQNLKNSIKRFFVSST